MMQEEWTQIELCVEEITYRNAQSGFAVLQGVADRCLITVVGELATVEVGENLLVSGTYVEHPSFGAQFKAQTFSRKLPTTARAIQKFLSSGAVKGIGPVLSERIVEKFGAQALEKIEEDSSCLRAIKGVSPSKLKKLEGEFEKLFGMRRLMIYLEGFGVKPTDSVKAWIAWGVMALELIKSNPYRLCAEEIGLPFMQVDDIAQQLEVDTTSQNRIYSGLVYILQHNAQNNGYTCLPREGLIGVAVGLLGLSTEEVDQALDSFLERGKFCTATFQKEMIFLPVYYAAEQYIALRVSQMLSDKIPNYASLDSVIALEEERCGLTFAKLQRRAIKEAVGSEMFILTGGPGTGKTTILNAVISILEQQGFHVGICAPTGRAAKRLTEVCGKEATTIHRMLGVQRREREKVEFIHNQGNPLKYDAIIVDEMSMVDSLLFCSLLQAAKPGCKIILTGDYNQLPSVSAGNVLKDMLSSECVPSVELKEIFRQSAQSLIVTNAHAVVGGEQPVLERVDSDFFFMGRASQEKAAQTIAQLCAKRLPESYNYKPLEDIQVICPSRKTWIGSVELNKLLQKMLNPRSSGKEEITYGAYTFRAGDKVMQVRNNYDILWTKDGEEGQGIFNGDIGFIQSIQSRAGILQIDFDGRAVTYTTDMIKELDLAYAITIHKSQGNEFKAVVIPIMGKDSEFYNRNLLYTGITRARELLILVGSSQSVSAMVRRVQVNYRYTGLKQFICEEVLDQ